MLMQDGGRGSMILTFCIDQDLHAEYLLFLKCVQNLLRALEASVKFLTLQNIRTPLLSNVQCIYFTSLSDVQYIYFFLGWELEKQPKLR